MKEIFNREWIIENAIDLLEEYSGGITLRQLYYRLVARGMTNDDRHYKKVIGAMTKARWENIVEFSAFIDRERTMFGSSLIEEPTFSDKVETAKRQIKLWMDSYSINKWANQPYFIEVWIEKKALQGVFEAPCERQGVALAPCKGYPSLTFLHEASIRFDSAIELDKKPVILYFGDYDPSGENIPISIEENLMKMSPTIERSGIKVVRCALNPDKILKYNLVGVPPKQSDSRTRNWDGNSAVECDAIEPRVLSKICSDAISEYFDLKLYDELTMQEAEEGNEFVSELREFVKNI